MEMLGVPTLRGCHVASIAGGVLRTAVPATQRVAVAVVAWGSGLHTLGGVARLGGCANKRGEAMWPGSGGVGW